MRTTIQVAVVGLAFLPGFAHAASPLRLECSAEQNRPGRALVCEYSMLERLNERLAELHERLVQAGKAGRAGAGNWLAARDACRDVDCLDRFFEAGLREAKLAFVEVEERRPAPILGSGRGVPLRDLPERTVTPTRAPVVAPASQEPLARERSGLGVYAVLLFVVAALGYGLVAKRLTA